jgi:glucose 1-dehydrogenase
LAEAGAAVVVNHTASQEPAEALVADIRAAGGRAIAVEANVAREADVARLFNEALAAFGRLDLLVANAGIQRDATVAEMTLADWQAVMDVNLTGQFLCCRKAIRVFRQQKSQERTTRALGSIVCMSSVHEVIPWAGHVNYASSKGGVRLLMQSLAQEVAPDLIRVNAVAPGAIRTPINREAWETPEALQRLLQLIPYGRIGEPDDVARVVTWLSSDEADYVTGSTLFVDGGMTLYPGFADNG